VQPKYEAPNYSKHEPTSKNNREKRHVDRNPAEINDRNEKVFDVFP